MGKISQHRAAASNLRDEVAELRNQIAELEDVVADLRNAAPVRPAPAKAAPKSGHGK